MYCFLISSSLPMYFGSKEEKLPIDSAGWVLTGSRQAGMLHDHERKDVVWVEIGGR